MTNAIESKHVSGPIPSHDVGYIFTNSIAFFKELKNIFPFYKFDSVLFVFKKDWP